jgi:hypothetical protein
MWNALFLKRVPIMNENLFYYTLSQLQLFLWILQIDYFSLERFNTTHFSYESVLFFILWSYETSK